MKVIWLGQASLLIRSDAGTTVLVDPYFSDCVGDIDPEKRRRIPAEKWLWDIEPDVLVFTHDHIDHYDPETAPHFLKKEKQTTVLSPKSCWNKARLFGGSHNYVQFDPLTEWTEKDLHFTAVRAVHSDPDAIGILVDDGEKTLYITGDTLYSRLIFESLPDKIDAIFLPINGIGNNMNAMDAARFAETCNADLAVPLHWGMMDDLDPCIFRFEPKYIPEIYQEFEIK